MEQNSTVYRSDEINHIMGALAKAQGTYKPLITNQDAPGGRFANLQSILQATRESLSSNGLAFHQYIDLQDDGAGAVLLVTMLGHESGQFVSSRARIISAATERQTGTIYEIYKRRHATLLLGVAPSENDPMAFDDNGEELAEKQLINILRKPKEPLREPIDRNDVINKDQYEELLIELSGYEVIAKDIMEVYGIETLADLPRGEYHRARSKILKIKKTQEEYERRKN
jgi:hypothetical protein